MMRIQANENVNKKHKEQNVKDTRSYKKGMSARGQGETPERKIQKGTNTTNIKLENDDYS